MRYFKLTDDVGFAGRWHLSEVVDSRGAAPPFLDGAVHGEGSLAAELGSHGEAMDFSLTSFAVPVTTPALGEAIAGVAGADVERCPLVVEGYGGFEVLNALRVIDCLDESRS